MRMLQVFWNLQIKPIFTVIFRLKFHFNACVFLTSSILISQENQWVFATQVQVRFESRCGWSLAKHSVWLQKTCTWILSWFSGTWLYKSPSAFLVVRRRRFWLPVQMFIGWAARSCFLRLFLKSTPTTKQTPARWCEPSDPGTLTWSTSIRKREQIWWSSLPHPS